MLVAQYVEPLRDPQIEGLPRQLVTPVRLLVQETHVLHSDLPYTPKPLERLHYTVRPKRSHSPHAASDRFRDSAVAASVAFSISCTPSLILCPSSLVWSLST